MSLLGLRKGDICDIVTTLYILYSTKECPFSLSTRCAKDLVTVHCMLPCAVLDVLQALAPGDGCALRAVVHVIVIPCLRGICRDYMKQ